MIKNGEFCIYNDNEYELNEDSDGNLIIITTNRAIIDETFVDKYNSGVYSKVILPNEIGKAYDCQTYGVIKGSRVNVEKENEEDEWYSFAKTEYNGTDDIVINLQENTGSSVLKATFRISSKAQAGSEPIVKVIALKQGNKVEAERHSFVDNEWTITAGKPVFADGAVNFAYEGTNCRISREGMKPGSYKFHISASSNDAQCQLYFLNGEKEIRWMLFKGEGENARCGTSDGGVIQYPFNNKKSEYTVEMNILEGAPSGSMKLEWHLDGALLRSIPSYTGVAYGTNAQIILGVAKGTATYDWWEYTAPIEWGDE